MAIGSANCGQSTAGEPSMAATFCRRSAQLASREQDAGKVELYPPAELALRGHLAVAILQSRAPLPPQTRVSARRLGILRAHHRHSACAKGINKRNTK